MSWLLMKYKDIMRGNCHLSAVFVSHLGLSHCSYDSAFVHGELVELRV